MREALQIRINGVRLLGVRHTPKSTWPEPREVDHSRIGILMLNPGYLPRSTRGDLGANLGDFLAGLGFSVFRFDMPGLGDSDGELAEEVLQFFELVQTAGHEPFLSGLRRELVRRYGLRGMICLGHCGGATTTIYSADRNLSEDLLGLILLDPAFIWYRPPPMTPSNSHGLRNALAGVRQRLWNARHALRSMVLGTDLGEKLRMLRARLRGLSRRLQRERLPAEANGKVLRSWERVLGSGKPILVLTAGQSRKSTHEFDYLDYLERARPGSMSRVNIPGTSHSFVEGNGKQEVFRHVRQWLQQEFPTGAGPLPIDGGPGARIGRAPPIRVHGLRN